MNSRVSIIVPIYNSERYLSKCIESLLSQTYKRMEIVLIDDGSSDRSREIISKYAARYKNIKAILQDQNQGASIARNTGIDNATGEYLTFVDADDVISPNMIEELVDVALEHESDIVTCLFKTFADDIRFVDNNDSVIEAIGTEKFLVEVMYGQKLDSGPWAKLIRRGFVGDKRFDERLIIGEDLDFICNILYKQNANIALVNKAMYGYRLHQDSLMAQEYSDLYLQYFRTINKWAEKLNRTYESLKPAINYRIFGVASYSISKIKPSDRQRLNEDYTQYIQGLRKTSLSVIRNPRSSIKNRLLAIMYYFSPKLATWARDTFSNK